MNTFDSQLTPQFGKAEYVGDPGTDRCAACSQPILSEYYRVNGTMVCPTCVSSAQSTLPKDTHGAFMRAVLFGCGGALLGLILYSTFGIITGLVIGYLSLGVGYLVGKAMMMGSKGIGGRRYQIVAVLLTYAAVSTSAIPIAISMQSKQRREQKQRLADEQRQFEKESGQQPSEATPAQSEPAAESSQHPRVNLAAALGYLALIGLASPFLELQDPVHGFIGLIILLVGIRIAWQITAARLPEISGPFQNSPAS
jgi:predicted lipid-binding transport protein (Tim44 family)